MKWYSLLAALVVGFGAGSWFGDDLLERIQGEHGGVIYRAALQGHDQVLLTRVEERMVEVYASLEPTPAEFDGASLIFYIVPVKDGVRLDVKQGGSLVAEVSVPDDGDVVGEWLR